MGAGLKNLQQYCWRGWKDQNFELVEHWKRAKSLDLSGLEAGVLVGRELQSVILAGPRAY